MKVNGCRNKWGPGGLDSLRVHLAVLQQVTALSRRARRNRMHTNMHDRAPGPNTGSARGGMRAEHPEGCESRARAAGGKQCVLQLPKPQVTTHIEQLNTQEMAAYKPADSCVAA